MKRLSIKHLASILFLYNSLHGAVTPGLGAPSLKPSLFMTNTETPEPATPPLPAAPTSTVQPAQTDSSQSASANTPSNPTPTTETPAPSLSTVNSPVEAPMGEPTPVINPVAMPTATMASLLTTPTAQTQPAPMTMPEPEQNPIKQPDMGEANKPSMAETSSTPSTPQEPMPMFMPIMPPTPEANPAAIEPAVGKENEDKDKTSTENEIEEPEESMEDETPEEDVEENDAEEEITTTNPVIVMNSTERNITVYAQIKDNEVCLAKNLGPISQILVPSSASHLRIEAHNWKSYTSISGIIENDGLSIIAVQHGTDFDAERKELEISSIKQESEQAVLVYNTTTQDQQVKIVYPEDATFFYTPKIYYTIPALSARFMTLPIFNQKGIVKKVYAALPHSKKKIYIPASTEQSICVIYQEDNMVMLDNITEHFRE
jgi:hypothetical protein